MGPISGPSITVGGGNGVTGQSADTAATGAATTETTGAPTTDVTTAGLDSTTDGMGSTDTLGPTDTSTGEIPALGVDDLVAGDLVITEVMYNPALCTDANCEWIEVYNATGSPIDLQGLTVADVGASSGTIDDPAIIGSGEFAVLAAGVGDAWGYTFDPLAFYGATGPFFSQSEDDLVEISNAADTLDIMSYTTTGDTNAGASLELDPGVLDVDLNDDEAVWCVAQDDFGDGDLGSPGAANTTACP